MKNGLSSRRPIEMAGARGSREALRGRTLSAEALTLAGSGCWQGPMPWRHRRGQWLYPWLGKGVGVRKVRLSRPAKSESKNFSAYLYAEDKRRNAMAICISQLTGLHICLCTLAYMFPAIIANMPRQNNATASPEPNKRWGTCYYARKLIGPGIGGH